jgi:hypothetical protein
MGCGGTGVYAIVIPKVPGEVFVVAVKLAVYDTPEAASAQFPCPLLSAGSHQYKDGVGRGERGPGKGPHDDGRGDREHDGYQPSGVRFDHGLIVSADGRRLHHGSTVIVSGNPVAAVIWNDHGVQLLALWEREAAEAAVGEQIARVRHGQGSALFVLGEAGLGKTSLLKAACELAGDEIEVGLAGGHPLERALAFGMAHEAIGTLAGSGDAGLDAAGAVLDNAAPFYRVLRWLQARERPVLLALDDLHWADADSLRLFAFIARRSDRLPVALIGTLRPWPPEAAETVLGLFRDGQAGIERLEPLSRAAASTLLGELAAGELSETTNQRAWKLCAGNPLLIDVVARVLSGGEHLPELPRSAAAPEFARTLLLTRFAGLEPAAIECARAASVLGTSFRPELAVIVAGLPEADVERALEALCRSGLIVAEDGPQMRFAHALFAEALYGDLPAPLRRRLHERAFHALVDADAEAEAAGHAGRAELIGDARACEVLTGVGRAALQAGAIATAVENLEAAVRAGGPAAGAPLRTMLADALVRQGRTNDALAVLDAVLSDATVDWVQRHHALRMQGNALLLSARIPEAEAALDGAIAVAVAHGADELAVEPLIDLALTAFLLQGPRAALPARRAPPSSPRTRMARCVIELAPRGAAWH